MSNNFKVLLKSRDGVELKNFIEKNKDELKNKRIFYILQANLDKKKFVKIGISERGQTSAYGRLNDYYHFYSKTNKTNPCLGVKLHLVLANTFNSDVEYSNSRVRRLETKLKQRFKTDFQERERRGEERVAISIKELFDYLEANKLLEETEIEKPVRKTPRLQEKNQGSSDHVAKIISHKQRKDTILFEAEFKESFSYNRDGKATKPRKKPNQFLTYDQLVGKRNGKIAVDEYLLKNNKLDVKANPEGVAAALAKSLEKYLKP